MKVGLIFGIILVMIFFSNLTSAAWADVTYASKKEITLNTTDTVVKQNVTILLNITHVDGMMENFSDLVFYDAEEDNKLGFWFANNSYMYNDSVQVYVLLNRAFSAAANTTIFVYFNKPTAVSESNMSAAFLFADDFNAPINTNIWAQSTTSFYTSGGSLYKTVGGSWAAICSKFSMTNIYAEFRAWGTVGTGDPAMMDMSTTGAAERTYAVSITNAFLTGINGDTTGGTATNGTWYRGIYEARAVGANDFAHWQADTYGSDLQAKNATAPSHDHYFCMEGFGANKSRVDWVYVKTWIDNTKIFTNVGPTVGGDSTVYLNTPVNGTVSVDKSLIFNTTLSGNNQISNVTLIVLDINSNVLNSSFATLSGVNNGTTFNISGFSIGTYIWNAYWCVTTKCVYALNNYTLYWGFKENYQNFSAVAISGTQETFSINISYDSTSTPAITPYLVYNNTYYSPSVTSGTGDNKLFSTTITIPTVTTVTSKTFYWTFALTNSTGGQVTFNSTQNTQTVQALMVDNCAAFTSQIMNFTLFDEDARTQINGTIELAMDFYYPGIVSNVGQFQTSYIFSSGGSPLRICVNSTQINSSLQMDYHARYWGNDSAYAIENKFGQSISLINSSTAVNLYSLLDAHSTAFSITLQGANLDAISGALIDIQREYVPINQFISVETPLTDTLGTTVGHFVAEDVYYTFIITKNGELLGTFNKQLVKCQNIVTGDCRLVINLIEATAGPTDFQHYGNISVNYLWSQPTRSLLTTWLSSDGTAHTVIQNVTILDNWGNSTICSNSANGLSGSFTCNVPTSYGNTSIISYLYSDGTYLGFSVFNLGDSAQTIFGGTKVVLGMLMYTTLALLMIANPITLILGAILGMFFVVAFHLADGGSFFGNSSIFLWFLIAGGIVIYHISKRS